jgi:hypothetical protein
MLCEMCKEREATVHLRQTTREFSVEEGVDPETVDLSVVPHKEVEGSEKHFCEECADRYFASTPGMNSARGLICLSDTYRAKLHDKLEVELPEVFSDPDDEVLAGKRATKMERFLREELKREGIEVNDDAFGMLFGDLFCSYHFYNRQDRFNGR